MGNFYEEFIQKLDREAYHEGEYSWEEDGFTVYRSHPWSPPGCHNSCGVLFYVRDGVVDHVEGDPCSPHVNGKLCMRCLNMPEMLNHPDRLKYPMKRAGERGEGKWERISWDEAIDIIVEKANYYIKEYGVQSINVARGTGRDIPWSASLLAYLGFGTPNSSGMFLMGFSCYTPRVIACQAVIGDFVMVDASHGTEARFGNPEYHAPGVIMVWCNEPLKSNADANIGHWYVECMALGTKIISIDPRLTWWGARSEYWLQVRPGTDSALAMAFLNVVVSEDLYDHEFVEKWCYGFDQMCETVANCTPEWAAEICQVSADGIRGAARLFATEGPGAIQWGLAMEQQAGSTGLNLSVISLMAICGYVDVPGGMLIVRNAFGVTDTMSEGYIDPDNLAKRRVQRTPDAPFGESRQWFYDFEGHAPERVRMLVIQSTNGLANHNADALRVYDIYKDLEFVVGIDPFMTPTLSAFADIVLPVAMTTERDSLRTWYTPIRTISKFAEYYEAKDDTTIAIEIGRRIHPEAFPWKDAKDLSEWRLHGCDPSRFLSDGIDDHSGDTQEKLVGEGFSPYRAMAGAESTVSWDPDLTFDDLKQKGYAYDSFTGTYRKYEKGMLRADGQPGFNTNTGRIELYSLVYQAWNIPPLPEYVEPNQGPITTPELFEKYPVIMVSGVRSYEFFHSEHRQTETMREFHPWPLVCMNQDMADRYGIKDGEWVWIENDRGRFRQKAYVTPGVKDGCITTEHGWWFPEEKAEYPAFFGTFECNPNNLINGLEVGPHGIGAPVKNTLVRIYPVKEGDVSTTEQVVEMDGFDFQKNHRAALLAEWEEKGIVNN